MSAQPIGPGSMVVCIKADQNTIPGYALTVDALYCIEKILPWASPCTVDGCLEGFVLKGRTERFITRFPANPIAHIGYCPSQFRPLNDGDTSLVEKETDLDDANGGGLQTYRVMEPAS